MNSPEVITTPPETKPKPPDAGRRDFVVSLESARGLAALAVALFHSFHLIAVDGARVYERTLWDTNTPDSLLMRLIMIPFNGGAAVSLFFVLSGYVLTLSLRRDDRPVIPKSFSFAARRFLRIYPPLALNLVLMAGAFVALAALFPWSTIEHMTLNRLGLNLLVYQFGVNGATWTLQIELVVIPFLLIAWMLRSRFGFGGTIAFVVLSLFFLGNAKYLGRGLIANYLFMFAFGVLIADIGEKLSRYLTKSVSAASLAVALPVMLSARFFLGYGSRESLITEGICAAIIVAVLAYGPRLRVHHFLETAPLRFLGRTSYSFYLYHPLALGLFMAILTPLVTPKGLEAHPFAWSSVVALVTIAITIPLGWASFTYVEKPMVRLGRKV